MRMSNLPARRAPATVAIPNWSPDEIDVIRQRVAPGASDIELAHFAHECGHRGLDPLAGEIYGIMRWDSKAGREVLTIQVSVAGLRTIAERTGLYGGQDPPLWCGPDGQWKEVWLEGHPPAACKVAIYRKDWDVPCVGIATYSSYCQLTKDKKPKGLWASAPDYMLHKAAEAAALKRAFPDQMAAAGISTRDLSPQSRISMEARRAGLDDDARHELVERVTGGRTDSTRDLDDNEIVEVRAEIAALTDEPDDDAPAGPPPNVDPETGEDLNALAASLRRRVKGLPDEDQERFRAWLDEVGIGRAKPITGFRTDELYAVANWFVVEEANQEPF